MFRIPTHIAKSITRLTVVGVFICAFACSLSADEFFLRNGSKVEGQLLNPNELPRVNYEIKLTTGGNTSLKADDVLKFKPTSAAKRRYLDLLPRMPESADGNWKMAEWCLKAEKQLLKERTLHLEQAIALDPNHEKARLALGHRKVNGKWMARDEEMESRGLVKHKGRWRLPQEVALEEAHRSAELAEKTWRKDIRQWVKKLRRTGDQAAWQSIQSISDRNAASALSELLLAGEPDRRIRNLLIEVMSRLDSATAVSAIIQTSLFHPDADTRALCLEKIPDAARVMAVSAFTKALLSNDPHVVNRAGEGLRELKEPEVIPELIEALVTQHKRKVADANPGQIGTSFGRSSDGSIGGAGLSMGGGGPKHEQWTSQNRGVLEALLEVSDGANFGYDQAAWKRWLAETGAPQDLDLRRRD